MIKAIWKDTEIAESENTIIVEGNHYFPPADVKMEHLVATDYRTNCPWKGEAHYYNLVVANEKNINAAWSYPQPKEKAKHIAGYIAFWKDVSVG